MTPGDAARVLAVAALYDNRQTGEEDAAAWYAVIGDLDFADAVEAVRRHYRDSVDWLKPAHVRAGVRAIRDERDRQRPHEIRTLPSRFEPDMVREVRMAPGQAACREVLAPILEHLAAKRGAPLPSALEELRAITTGPTWATDADDEDQDGGAAS